jgi:hypothetical protein
MLELMEGEARPAILTTCVSRDGSITLWPLKRPREDESDQIAWSTAMDAAREAMKYWIKLRWRGGRYEFRRAPRGFALPDWTKLISTDEQIKIAFGSQGIIRNQDHPVYRGEVLGEQEDDGDDVGGEEA